MNIRQCIMVAGLVGSARPATSQEPATWASPIEGDSSLRVLVAEALERNPRMAQRHAAIRAATLRIRPAGTLPDPMLSAGVMNLPLPKFALRESDFTEVDVELTQEIPWPGTLGARSAVARAVARGADAQLGNARREIAVSTATAYYRLRYAAAALQALERQALLLEAAVQLSTTRYATGAAPQIDPLQARLARDRLGAEEAALRGEYVVAQAAVNALRDRPSATAVAAAPFDAGELRAVLAPLPPPDSLATWALAVNPRVAAERAALEQATRTIDVERLASRPDFTFTTRYGHRPQLRFGFDPPDFFSAFVGLRLPVWAGRKQNRLADAARADSAAAVAALRETELALEREAVEIAARADAARRRLKLLVDGVVPAARATVESAVRSYQVGRVEFLTLVFVEDALFRAEVEAAAVAAELHTHLVMLRQLTAGESQP
ncbi:MAG: TolC family protein [Gemmatimonadales bacterium]